MSVCMVRGTKAWYKLEVVMRETGERVVIDEIDLMPPPMEIVGGYAYWKKGVRGEIKGYSELDLYVVSVTEEKDCGKCPSLHLVPDDDKNPMDKGEKNS